MLNPLASLERRIISAILTRIRAHSGTVSESRGDTHAHHGEVIAQAKLRAAQFSDYAAVTELKRRWGLIPDSLENWEKLWRNNPALARTQFERPIGWVLEADGRVVGYHGNIPLIYRYGDRTLAAVTSHGFVVEPSYRALGLTLSAAFFRQTSVDLWVITTAIESSGKIARAFKTESLSQTDYDTVLFWVLNPSEFARAVMTKLRLKSPLSWVGRQLVSFAVRFDTTFRGRRPKTSSRDLAVRDLAVSEIGEEFQSLWDAKLNEGARLFADRSPAVLKWHFEIPGDTGNTRVLCCHANGELAGYAVVRNGADREDGLVRSVIADMLVKQDDPYLAEALFVAAYANARRAGSHVLEVKGLPQSIRKVCSQWNPYERQFPSSPYFYKAADPVLQESLKGETAWYATPFDGDATLMP